MLWVLVSLIIGVFIHEVGHFIVAKKCGCSVEVFSIGFGKPILWKKKIGKTLFQVTLWLIGGYNRLKGEMTVSDAPDAFTNMKYFYKVKIITAGIIMNLLLGTILLGIFYRVNIGMAENTLKLYPLYIMGKMNLLLGIANLIPFPPLDGSCILTIPIFEKIWGKKEGYIKLKKVNKIGFFILHLMVFVLLGLMLIGVI